MELFTFVPTYLLEMIVGYFLTILALACCVGYWVKIPSRIVNGSSDGAVTAWLPGIVWVGLVSLGVLLIHSIAPAKTGQFLLFCVLSSLILFAVGVGIGHRRWRDHHD
jgi:hypothetical protein